MLSRRQAFAAIVVAPLAGLGLGVWAEFADLNAPLLFAVALPAIIVSALSAASLVRGLPGPLALLLAGVAVGTLTFALTEGTYLAIHFSRGGTVNFEGLGSQRAMALALLGIHVMAGAAIGAGVGAGLAALSMAGRWAGLLRQA